MAKILNLTQHNATSEQLEQGVFELPENEKVDLTRLLTFNEIPSLEEIRQRARAITEFARDYQVESAMIGGAPYLMGTLELTLKDFNVTPLYSFTQRKSVEVNNPDGSVTKTAVFKHIGFVQV